MASVGPLHRSPFEVRSCPFHLPSSPKRQWRARQDSNQRPLAPEADGLNHIANLGLEGPWPEPFKIGPYLRIPPRRSVIPRRLCFGMVGLFEAHHQGLYRLARRFVATRDEARDLVQDTFVRAAQTWRPSRPASRTKKPGSSGCSSTSAAIGGDAERFDADSWNSIVPTPDLPRLIRASAI
jgi:hypothetical protein